MTPPPYQRLQMRDEELQKQDEEIRKQAEELQKKNDKLEQEMNKLRHELRQDSNEMKRALRQKDQNSTLELIKHSIRQDDLGLELKKMMKKEIENYLQGELSYQRKKTTRHMLQCHSTSS